MEKAFQYAEKVQRKAYKFKSINEHDKQLKLIFKEVEQHARNISN